VDDGSTDCTSEYVKKYFPSVTVIRGDGNLFWNRGMIKAYNVAILQYDFDAFLLLNDDVYLYNHGFDELLRSRDYSWQRHNSPGIYTGSTEDSSKSYITYGGYNFKYSKFFFSYQRVQLRKLPNLCDFANGNILLIDTPVVKKIGFLDHHFWHALGDFDLTIRAKKAGFPIYNTSEICGICDDDKKDRRRFPLYFGGRVKYLYDVRGIDYKRFCYFYKNHFPLFLPLFFLKTWSSLLFSRK
jgi:GT2 family glycosyltransferase